MNKLFEKNFIISYLPKNSKKLYQFDKYTIFYELNCGAITLFSQYLLGSFQLQLQNDFL
jgi:hypothetical protein